MSNEDGRFGHYMKRLREACGLLLDEAARRIGVGVEILRSWENGDELPSELSSVRISGVYGVSQTEWLEALAAENRRRGTPSK